MKKLFLWVALLGFGTTTLLAQAQKNEPSKTQAEVKAKPALTAKPAVMAKVNRPVKKNGMPDKRYKANKHVKQDGTPDLRYKEHKAAQPAPAIK